MQSFAAVEAEIAEVVQYGPGGHLGSNGVELKARDFLLPLAELIDNQRPAVERYQTVLHVLGRPPFARGSEPFQSAALLGRLRNELVHYKSKWGADMETERLFTALESHGLKAPPFASQYSNFFPHHCLGAERAVWAVRAAISFVDAFYERLGVTSHLEAHRAGILAVLQ